MNEVNTYAHPQNACNGRYGKCLDVKITNECNGHCAFCIEKNGYCPKPAPVETLIAATMAQEDYQKVLVLGGEPFLYKDLRRYLKGIRSKQEVYITTNGSMLNAKTAAQVAKYITAINISVHHYDEEMNAAVYGLHIPFSPIAEAIGVFRKAGVRVRINTNLVKGILSDPSGVDKMILLAEAMGADEVRFAELQYCPELYVPASSIFSGLPSDPFQHGCEVVLSGDEGIKTIVRQACGLVNPSRQRPENPICSGSQTKVLYPNGEVCGGWKKTEKAVSLISADVFTSPVYSTCGTGQSQPEEPSCHMRSQEVQSCGAPLYQPNCHSSHRGC